MKRFLVWMAIFVPTSLLFWVRDAGYVDDGKGITNVIIRESDVSMNFFDYFRLLFAYFGLYYFAEMVVDKIFKDRGGAFS